MTKHPYVTTDLALQALEQAVAKRGESFVYTSRYLKESVCRYVDAPMGGGAFEPACIVGVALSELGWTTEEIKGIRNTNVLEMVAFTPRLEGDHEAFEIWMVAQKAQDGGQTWGQALAEARTRAGELVSV